MPGAILSTTPNNGVNRLFLTEEETKKPEEVTIEGKIPSYITGGKYLRVGPCKFDFKDFTVNHWLDGYALLSKFEIKDNAIVFEKRYLQSDAYKRAVALQKPAISEFGTRAQADEKKGFLSRVISTLLPEFTDNSYSSLFQVAGDVFATCDSQYFQQINSSLEINCRCDANKLFGVNGQCAHPLTDKNGDVFNFGFSIGATGLKYHLFKMPYAKSSQEMMKQGNIISTISPRWTGMMGTTHSFGMSQNYIIFVEQPYVVSTKRIAASFIKKDVLKDWLEWRPEDKNRFYILEKSTGKVLKTEYLSTNSFYFMHFINCYEESNQIIMDLIIYDSPNVMETMLLDDLRNGKKVPFDLPYIQRFIIPIIPDLKVGNIRDNLNLVTKPHSQCTAIKSGNKIIISGEKICGDGFDLPTTNKRFLGRRTRYVYAAGTFQCDHEFSNSIVKVDLETKQVWKWKYDDFTFPGEPYFIPDPKGVDEDDGVVITGISHSRQEGRDMIAILDAKTFKVVGQARFKNRIPPSLHGLFLPN